MYHVKRFGWFPTMKTDTIRSMGSVLPEISRDQFSQLLRSVHPAPLPEKLLVELHGHYRALRQWNRRSSLVGPGTVGTADEVVERHYGESLAALPWIPPRTTVALDIGSGAGFPGWVLAAARRDLEFTLVEGRQRKWAFLRAISREAALSCHCLNVRVAPPLPPEIPGGIDLITVRAVRLATLDFSCLMPRLAQACRLIVWAGGKRLASPTGFVRGRSVPLAGSAHRRLLFFDRHPADQ